MRNPCASRFCGVIWGDGEQDEGYGVTGSSSRRHSAHVQEEFLVGATNGSSYRTLTALDEKPLPARRMGRRLLLATRLTAFQWR